MTKLFQALFPTKITPFGKSLFLITWENDYIARQTRIGRLNTIVYRMTIERV